jgi:drug/metabolite transporter (DMT)-like permease
VFASYVIWKTSSLILPDVVPKFAQSNPMSLVVGLAVLLLLGERLAKLKWPALTCVSFLIIVVMGFIGLSGVNSVFFDGIQPQILAVIIGGPFVIVLSTAFTAKKCQRKFSNKRFLLFLLMWFMILTVVPSIAAAIGTFGVAIVIQYSWWFFMAAAVQGLLIYLLTLPLWILALKNLLYNQRLNSCLGLVGQTAEA